MSTVDLSRAAWRTGSRSSGNGQCVEIAFVAGVTAARDSKNPDGGTLLFTPRGWSAFVNNVDAARR